MRAPACWVGSCRASDPGVTGAPAESPPLNWAGDAFGDREVRPPSQGGDDAGQLWVICSAPVRTELPPPVVTTMSTGPTVSLRCCRGRSGVHRLTFLVVEAGAAAAS